MTNGNSERLGKASGLSRRLLALLVGLLATVALIASGAPSAAAETRVGAQPQNLILAVGPQATAAPNNTGLHTLQLRPIASATGVAAESGSLASRVDELHGALDPIAQNSRTTAVMSTREGSDILASGGRDLSPAQRALAGDGDVLARLPSAHAEITALDAAAKAGLTPSEIAVSRLICPEWQAAIEGSGGTITNGGLGALWP